MTQETMAYDVTIILSTFEGELPSEDEVQQLIEDQMSGELDETTGLACVSVVINKVHAEIG